MRKLTFRPRIWLQILLALFCILILLLRFEIVGQPILTMSFRYSDRKITSLFRGEDVQPEIKYHNFNGQVLRYVELVTNKNLPYVIFIHGAPGSSADYYDYFRNEELYERVNLISIDRLGYGYSDFGNSQTSIQQQGEAIQSIIEKSCLSQHVILVGHSYGGPIAVRMAMDNPTLYKSLLLLAPALDPENEKVIKIARLANIKPTSWITPAALKVAADEKFSHTEELRKMIPFYKKIAIPVCHIHGTKDSLVPYENLDFSIKHFPKNLIEPLTLGGEDHFLPWSQKELIVKKIIEAAIEN